MFSPKVYDLRSLCPEKFLNSKTPRALPWQRALLTSISKFASFCLCFWCADRTQPRKRLGSKVNFSRPGVVWSIYAPYLPCDTHGREIIDPGPRPCPICKIKRIGRKKRTWKCCWKTPKPLFAKRMSLKAQLSPEVETLDCIRVRMCAIRVSLYRQKIQRATQWRHFTTCHSEDGRFNQTVKIIFCQS